MDPLLQYYEAELAHLNALCQDFSMRYPQLAGRLGVQGNSIKDPHVERLVQASALLSARTAKRLDDSYAQFTESLLEMNVPHYLRPFPACAIACVDAGSGPGKVATIPRGTVMNAIEQEGVICKFTTAYDVKLAQLRLTEARYRPMIACSLKDLKSANRDATITGATIGVNRQLVAKTSGTQILRSPNIQSEKGLGPVKVG